MKLALCKMSLSHLGAVGRLKTTINVHGSVMAAH